MEAGLMKETDSPNRSGTDENIHVLKTEVGLIETIFLANRSWMDETKFPIQ